MLTYIIIIIIIKKRLAMQGREREIATRSVKSREQLGQQKGIGPGLETRQSHNIEYGVNQSVPERY